MGKLGQTKPFVANGGEAIDETAQEEKFLTDVLAGYNYWNKQPGDRAKGYAEAYKALLNEFTKEDTNS